MHNQVVTKENLSSYMNFLVSSGYTNMEIKIEGNKCAIKAEK
ncbi:MAG: hypothetical protein K0R18_282 [Bacillales bacterium]|jgi:hypothetical protein|nr:hypothetical protein [Bacillales bacterium]